MLSLVHQQQLEDILARSVIHALRAGNQSNKQERRGASNTTLGRTRDQPLVATGQTASKSRTCIITTTIATATAAVLSRLTFSVVVVIDQVIPLEVFVLEGPGVARPAEWALGRGRAETKGWGRTVVASAVVVCGRGDVSVCAISFSDVCGTDSLGW